MKTLVDKLRFEHSLTKSEWIELISSQTPELSEYVFAQAREVRDAVYGHEIYIRGLIEFTNYCRNDCYYCGIRKSNQNTNRFRLTPDEILSCCQVGYDLGFRTFVLQGGEDGYFTDERLIALIRQIKKDFPACAVTLSARNPMTVIRRSLKQALTDICCAMKLPASHIIKSFTPLLFQLHTVRNVCMI